MGVSGLGDLPVYSEEIARGEVKHFQGPVLITGKVNSRAKCER